MKNIPRHQNTSPVTYPTSDLGLAVFLFTAGHELVRTELDTPRRLCFHFVKGPATEALVLRYFSGKAEAPAQTLFFNYRKLRALTYERTGNIRRG